MNVLLNIRDGIINVPGMNVKEVQHIIDYATTLREESSQTNVILQYKLLALILSAVCSVIQQS